MRSAVSGLTSLIATPHASFFHPGSNGVSMLRESIEARVFVFDAPLVELPKQVGILYGKKESANQDMPMKDTVVKVVYFAFAVAGVYICY